MGIPPNLELNRAPALVHDSILSTIGKTPVVRLSNKMAPAGVEVFVKCEQANPMGSVKDRLALGVIEWAEANGQLKSGQTVVEASSGNTGIGLAMVCAAKGYPFVCVMSESFSIERRKLMRFLGAKVVLTNPAHKGSGMVIKAEELAQHHGWFLPRQFDSEANAWMHEMTTGPEIVEQLCSEAGRGLDHFVCAYGTGGTLNGVSRVLRAQSPGTKIHVCEPDNAPLLHSGIETEYPDGAAAAEGAGEGAPATSSFAEVHPVWRPHLLQGWAPDWIPKLVSEVAASKGFDGLLHVGGDEAMAVARDLARKEGIFTGTSGGGTLACALRLAASAPEGTRILAMLADTGERYLSTPLFEDIPADMTEEEKEIAASTPSQPPPPATLPAVTPAATEFVSDFISKNKVAIFSLEYCEFCWTIFRFFDAIGVPYSKVNIDAFEYAEGNVGNTYRAALQERTDCKTFPQVFIDGEYLGGAADACIKWRKGELQPLLEAAGLKQNDFNGYEGDPFEFLPKWMTQNPLRSK
eukprot:CAMPEP_0174919146 /NCGR_PEP_ID=MMETSP1355-20121228/3502_1 /TAXON_ID=464990 /ORGANISM="Hemiselmis tepida, Strain CCMP443" /LENGTH=521 /DNA_ID=CAMNT_0016164359 /DNA_START=61 /DNA_END=1626 /DNA_ORIENTATION=-